MVRRWGSFFVLPRGVPRAATAVCGVWGLGLSETLFGYSQSTIFFKRGFMSSTLGLALLLVLWIFVLAPIVVRNQKPIRKTTDALDKTRVVVSGGQVPTTGRRPRLLPTDVHVVREDVADAEDVDDDDIIIDDDLTRRGEDSAVSAVEEIVDGDLVDEQVSTETELAEADAEDAVVVAAVVPHDDTVTVVVDAGETPDAAAPERDVEEDSVVALESEQYSWDDSYVGPADLLHPDAEYTPTPEEEEIVEPVPTTGGFREAFAAKDLQFSEEDLAYAASRRSATAFNPQREAEKWAKITRRRQRVLAGFAAACVVSLIVAFVFGGFTWALPVLAIGFSIAYMVALRNQVVMERDLRAQRIARLKRQRLGVRTTAEDHGRAMPGTVVVSADDESPDFEELDVVYSGLDIELDDPAARHAG